MKAMHVKRLPRQKAETATQEAARGIIDKIITPMERVRDKLAPPFAFLSLSALNNYNGRLCQIVAQLESGAIKAQTALEEYKQARQNYYVCEELADQEKTIIGLREDNENTQIAMRAVCQQLKAAENRIKGLTELNSNRYSSTLIPNISAAQIRQLCKLLEPIINAPIDVWEAFFEDTADKMPTPLLVPNPAAAMVLIHFLKCCGLIETGTPAAVCGYRQCFALIDSPQKPLTAKQLNRITEYKSYPYVRGEQASNIQKAIEEVLY